MARTPLGTFFAPLILLLPLGMVAPACGGSAASEEAGDGDGDGSAETGEGGSSEPGDGDGDADGTDGASDGSGGGGGRPRGNGLPWEALDPVAAQIATGEGLCTPTGLPLDDGTGRLACSVLELVDACDCSADARAEPSEERLATARDYFIQTGHCGEGGCFGRCFCEITQAPGERGSPDDTWHSSLYACQNELSPPGLVTQGFCGIDLERFDATGTPDPIGEPLLVSECDEGERAQVRFVGSGRPAQGASVLLICDTCGNDICEPMENCANCGVDCGCSDAEICAAFEYETEPAPDGSAFGACVAAP